MIVRFTDNAPITVGSSHTHGGSVLEGDPRIKIAGRPVSFKGCNAECSQHGSQSIATASGKPMIAGEPVAIDGDTLTCGAVLNAVPDVALEVRYKALKEKYDVYRAKYDQMSPEEREQRLRGQQTWQGTYTFFNHSNATGNTPVFAYSMGVHDPKFMLLITFESDPAGFMSMFNEMFFNVWGI